MREIKFRGKRVDNGEWVYGCPAYGFGGKAIKYMMPKCYFATREMGEVDEQGEIKLEDELALGGFIPVHPETVGQYTGLKDKDGKEIYEGYVVKDSSKTMQIVFKEEACQFWLIWKDSEGVNRYKPLTATYGDNTGYFSNDSLQVIGNIHDNPNLLQP